MSKELDNQIKISASQEKTEINVAIIQNDMGYLKAKQEEMNKKLDLFSAQFVTKTEFQLVKTVVYGLVGIVLIAVLTAVLLNVGLKV